MRKLKWRLAGVCNVKSEATLLKNGWQDFPSDPSEEAGVLDLFAFLGPSPEEVLRQYHAVTGWPRLPLLAVLGKHQSRWNYVTPQDVLEAGGAGGRCLGGWARME